MRFRQILVYETDGRIAELLRRENKARTAVVREPRRLDTCLRLLEEGGPGVLILRLGRDFMRELSLLDQITWLYPETATIVIGDSAAPPLLDLVWDLGAGLVLPYCPAGRALNEIVRGFLTESEKTGNPTNQASVREHPTAETKP
jgi:DNA-binding NarL/FixJ family response regulator